MLNNQLIILFIVENMRTKVGREKVDYIGTSPNMFLPFFRKRHSMKIKYSKRDLILGFLLAASLITFFFWYIGTQINMTVLGGV